MELREAFPPGTNIQRPERGLLRMAVLGPPEVFHDGSRLTFSLRKAQALLLYLALVRYLGHFWKDHGSRVLLLGTVRRDQLELTPALSARLADLRRDLPITQVALQPLSQEETLQLVEAIVGEGEHGCRSGGECCELGSGRQATLAASPASETPVDALGDFLFAHTGGQPLYLLETLKLFRDREWLVPRVGDDGTWRLELVVEMAPVVAQKRVGRELVPPSVRAMILARLSKLTQPARQLVMASAVLGSRVSAQLMWQVAELGVQASKRWRKPSRVECCARRYLEDQRQADWAAIASPMS